MADIVTSEITEVSRLPMNYGPGKKVQLVELHIVHTFVNNDYLLVSAIEGVSAIVAVLGVQVMAGNGWFASTDAGVAPSLRKRYEDQGQTGFPTTTTVDGIIFLTGGDASIDQCTVQLLVEP